MKFNSILLFCAFSALTCFTRVHAEDAPNPIYEPMTFSFEDGLVKAIGSFEWDTSEKFRAFLTEQNK